MGSSPPSPPPMVLGGSLRGRRDLACGSGGSGFPSFLPKEVENIKDPFARNLAQRIVRLPVKVTLLVSHCSALAFLALDFFFSGSVKIIEK